MLFVAVGMLSSLAPECACRIDDDNCIAFSKFKSVSTSRRRCTLSLFMPVTNFSHNRSLRELPNSQCSARCLRAAINSGTDSFDILFLWSNLALWRYFGGLGSWWFVRSWQTFAYVKSLRLSGAARFFSKRNWEDPITVIKMSSFTIILNLISI